MIPVIPFKRLWTQSWRKNERWLLYGLAGSAGHDYGDWAFHWACLLGDRTILWAYHSRPLQQTVRAGILMERRSEWVRCPICKNKTRTKLYEDIELRKFPLYCPKCRQETLIDAKGLTRICRSLTRLFSVLSLTESKFPMLTRNPERGKSPSSITSSVHLTSHG